MSDTCALCGTDKQITYHHLIPKTCHKNKWFKKNFEMIDMRERQIPVCRKCHSFIHNQYSEKVLGREFNTLEMLLADEKVRKFIVWKKKQH
jgi:NAD-dependent SIR2 family protein deacetylase